MSIDLNAPSTSINPCISGDTTQVTGGSPDSAPSGLTKVGANPIQTCHEFQSSYPLTLPRVTSAALSALTVTVNGMSAYDSTYAAQKTLSNSVWALEGQQLAVVSLNRASVQGMFAAPVVIMAAPGAGKTIRVHKAMLVNNYSNATQFTNGGAIRLQYGATIEGLGTNVLSATIPATFLTTNAAVSFYELASATGYTGAVVTGISNLGVYLSNATAAFATGGADTTLVAYVWYSLITSNAGL